MKIRKLTICNFRSYCGKKEFVFSDHLNLILGSNGDGKTTFFEAINWALTPDYAPKADVDKLPEDRTLVSAKMFKELETGKQSNVSVILEISNNGKNRIVERSFRVSKSVDGEMIIDNRLHKAYSLVGQMRKEIFIRDLFEKEGAFPAIIKKYHIFKGEDKLNIFNDKHTLQALIDMFSEVKDLGPYKDFAVYAEKTSEKALSGSKDKASKQNAKLLSAKRELTALTKQLEKEEGNLATAKKEFTEAKEQIEAIDADYEIIQKVSELEKEVSQIENEISRLNDKIDEDYSLKLLDDQWILMGFAPILNDYNRKLESLSLSKDNIETEYRKKQEREYQTYQIDSAKKEIEKINWSYSDVEHMKYMLNHHRCVYCGSEAIEGSIPFDFIKQRLNDVINLLSPKPEDTNKEYKRYFSLRNIESLRELGVSLAHTGKDIDNISDEIEAAFNNNEEIRALIATKVKKLNSIKKNISSLYASSSTGENLKDYVRNINVVNKWHEQKQSAAITMDRLLTKTIPSLKEDIKKAQEGVAKNRKLSGEDPIYMLNEFFRMFSIAIENTENSTYEEFLDKLAKEANLFLTRLNVDDFTGIIKIYLDRYNDLKIELQDKNGRIITNPNTSLLTTMHISILFAISELTRENRNADYPLIFDAPTSSFDEGKDKTFYECLNSQVNKQCIVVTKSYLYKNDSGEYVTDTKSLNSLNCQKYRIRKLSGFDKLDITTIDTQIEAIN